MAYILWVEVHSLVEYFYKKEDTGCNFGMVTSNKAFNSAFVNSLYSLVFYCFSSVVLRSLRFDFTSFEFSSVYSALEK